MPGDLSGKPQHGLKETASDEESFAIAWILLWECRDELVSLAGHMPNSFCEERRCRTAASKGLQNIETQNDCFSGSDRGPFDNATNVGLLFLPAFHDDPVDEMLFLGVGVPLIVTRGLFEGVSIEVLACLVAESDQSMRHESRVSVQMHDTSK